LGEQPVIELTNATGVDRDLDPNVSAVVVIDLQNDFCHSEGGQAIRGKSVLAAQLAAHASEQFVAAARERGVPIFFVQTTHSDRTDSAAWMKRHRPNEPSTNCRVGTWGAEFYHVQPQPDDVVVRKHRYSAFVNTRLAGLLRDAGRSSLYFVGVATGVCVESSLRDAVCLDFEATLVADCCGDYDDSAHRNALASVESGFGEVMNWKQVVQAWDHMGLPPVLLTP
jgi:ureidoacrylate peracid hydrolase